MLTCSFAFRAVFFKILTVAGAWGISVDSAAWHAGVNRHFPVVKRASAVAHFVPDRTGLLK